ncbi:MAG: hypothetical protein LBG43_10935 [Treponema sp.]|jgi:hypothetical protein|nr:hypothetical protein [Treponema sp.]
MFGSISGVMQQDMPAFMKTLYLAPAGVFWITDARCYAFMRLAIERDMALSWKPPASILRKSKFFADGAVFHGFSYVSAECKAGVALKRYEGRRRLWT